MHWALSVLSKQKNKLIFLGKLFISFYALWWVLQKDIHYNFSDLNFFPIFYILFFFSLLNWFFEVKKWQFLAGQVMPVSFYIALKQSLVSFVMALLTPNRLGEYGAKAIFYPKENRKSIMGLNLIGNLAQLLTTLFFGIIGLIFLEKKNQLFEFNLPFKNNFLLFLTFIIFLAISFLFLFYVKYLKYSFNKLFVWKKSFTYSTFRYLTFSTQFLLLYLNLHSFERPLLVLQAIYLSYFFASFIPVWAITDWAVKGSLSFWVFSQLNLPMDGLLKIIGMMWMFNFLLPFLIGIIFIWKSKYKFL